MASDGANSLLLVNDGLDRARRHPAVMTFVAAERAVAAARAAEGRRRAGRSLGPLDGRAAVVKDLFDLAGRPARCGGVVSCEATAGEDATVVTALEAAGCCIVGTTNMTELAFSGLGINPHYGTPVIVSSSGTRHVPGGSSSGGAAAITAGIAAVSIGSDTSGSVRIPAAFHGIVGFKASAGRYPDAGMVALAPSLDSIGILAADVETVAEADAALVGADGVADAALRRPVLVVPDGVAMEGLEPAVEQQFHAALRALHRAGFAVEMRPVPEIDAILGEQQRVGTLVGMEAWRRHRAHLERHRTAMDPRVALRLERGGAAGDEVYEALLGRRGRLAAASQEMFAGAMLVLPTVACTSPLLQPLLDDDDAYFAANARVLRNTMIANLLDWCAVSLPMGRDERGLWTGFMLCAGRGQDRALLEVARLLAPIILQ